MEAGFGFGPEFAPKPKFIRAGFDRIASDLLLPAHAKTRLRRAFAAAIVTGDRKKERAAVASVLRGIDWRWPWFDRSADLFEKNGVWPIYWRNWDILPRLQWDAIPIEVREEFLLMCLAGAVYGERDFADITEVLRDGAGGVMTVIGSNDACEVEKTFVEVYRPRIEAGDYSVRPAFFPGDGSRISWLTPRKLRERDGA